MVVTTSSEHASVRTFISFLENAERRRRERVSEESRRRRGMVSCRRSDDNAGPSSAPPPQPSGASGADAAGEDQMKTSSFSFIYYISPYYIKTIYISIKSM
jgi:hypothetical protein